MRFTHLPPLSALREWAETHVPDIERARAAADPRDS
ncbi:DNA-binding HxlR family transcriptional regulator [Nocardioides luteus]|nr:DNA-binding HxlR family transcriptional regulator [Nocardioides luteus]